MPIVGAFIVPHPPIILPEIGRGQEAQIQKTIVAYQEIARRIEQLKPDTIVVTTPHSILYSDYIHLSPGSKAEGSFKDFGVPNVKMAVDYDNELVKAIIAEAESEGISAGMEGERNKLLDHGTMVPLYFINQRYSKYKLVRIAISGLPLLTHYDFGRCLAKAIKESNKRVVLIASGDLSHKLKEDGPYGLSEEGPIFDKEITQAIAVGDFLKLISFDESFCDAAAECGLRSFIIMSGALDGKSVKSELLSYEGPFGVGYAVAAYEITGEDENRQFGKSYQQIEEMKLKNLKKNEDSYVRLARQTLEHYVNAQTNMDRPLDIPEELTNRQAGVFVSLKLNGRLRGCIGTIFPCTGSVADEIIRNVVLAGTEDPRFEPVRKEELSKLVYSVDVLGQIEPISSIEELDTKRYGVIVRTKSKSGLLLPNLVGIDSPIDQVNIALKKAGISYHERYEMDRFEVVRHF
ncbi:MAG: AmmeMemoRadiSam system protein A [Clostridiaceae bacterium]